MSMKYRIAATTLSRIRSDAAEAIDLDDDELDEYKGYIKVTDAIDKATAKWLENYADEIRRECVESFKETIAKCADILPNKVECVITGSDIERIEAAIIGKEDEK